MAADAAAAAASADRSPSAAVIAAFDPGTANLGMAVLRVLPPEADAVQRRADLARWLKHAPWTATWKCLHLSSGTLQFLPTVAACLRKEAYSRRDLTHVVIEQQPGAQGNPTVRQVEGMLHQRYEMSHPAVPRTIQNGSRKNDLVDAVHAAWPGCAGLKFRKVPRQAAWTAVSSTGFTWCTVQPRPPATQQRRTARTRKGASHEVCVTLPEGFEAHGSLALTHGSIVPVAQLLGPEKSTRGDWKQNKIRAEEALTALLCVRVSQASTAHARGNAVALMLAFATLDTAHRHDVCDALLHALAHAVYTLSKTAKVVG